MRDGNYVFYCLQFKVTHKTQWLQPTGELKKCLDDSELDWDICGTSFYEGLSNKLLDEKQRVWSCTGYAGFWSLPYVLECLVKCTKDSFNGKFNYVDSYGKATQAVRYGFRIVKVTLNRKVEPIY